LFEEYQYVVRGEDYNRYPLEWKAIFGNANPITVEIGFGNGEYTLEMAKKYPDRNFIGFEMSINSVQKTQRRLYREDIRNVRIIMTDGRFGLRNLFGEEQVECVIVNFPCPWSKEKHFKRRITVPEFFRTLGSVLEKGGRFELATDVLHYAVDSKRIAQQQGFDTTEIHINDDREIMTRFEAKWRKYERNIHTLKAYKNQTIHVERLLKEDEPMPHATVNKNAPVEKVFELINRQYKSNDESRICVYKGTFRDRDANRFLVKTIAVDTSPKEGNNFEQHFFIDVINRKKDWIIKLDSVSNPYRTPAVKFAVQNLARELNQQ